MQRLLFSTSVATAVALSASRLQWRNVACGAPRRAGHASVSHDGQLWGFGGLSADRTSLSTFWTFDGQDWRAAPLAAQSEVPQPRMYGSLAASSVGLVLSGGWDPGVRGSAGRFYDDLHVYRPADGMWRRSKARLPAPVSRHVSVALPGAPHRVLLHTFRDAHEVLIYDAAEDTLVAQPTQGPAPAGYSMQGAIALADSLLVFGGATREQTMSNRSTLLNTSTWEWTELPTLSETAPCARAGCTLLALDEAACVLVSGASLADRGAPTGGPRLVPCDDVWVGTLSKRPWGLHWRRVRLGADEGAPAARVGAGCNSLDGHIYLHGGWDPASAATYADTWQLALLSDAPAAATDPNVVTSNLDLSSPLDAPRVPR